MSYKPPFNPGMIRSEGLSIFSGIAGRALEVLRTKDSKGHDISGRFANELFDLDCNVRGQMRLRPGFRKTSTTGGSSTIRAIFEVRLGGGVYYAIDYAGTLQLIELPSWPLPAPEKLPDPETLPTDYPSTFPDPREAAPVNDVPADDPSVAPVSQACPLGFVMTASPATLTFTMPVGGPLPASKNWYDCETGWWDSTVKLLYTDGASWITRRNTTFAAAWVTAPCRAVNVHTANLSVNSAALTFVPGVYITALSLSGGGQSVGVAITLNVQRDPYDPANVIRYRTWYYVNGILQPGYPHTYTDGNWSGTPGTYAVTFTGAGGDKARQKTDGSWEIWTGSGWYDCGDLLVGTVSGTDPNVVFPQKFDWTTDWP